MINYTLPARVCAKAMITTVCISIARLWYDLVMYMLFHSDPYPFAARVVYHTCLWTALLIFAIGVILSLLGLVVQPEPRQALTEAPTNPNGRPGSGVRPSWRESREGER